MKNLQEKGVSFTAVGELSDANREKLQKQVKENRKNMIRKDLKSYYDYNDSINATKNQISL